MVWDINSVDNPLKLIVNQFLTQWSWETSLMSELARIPLPGAEADLLVRRAISIAPWSQTAKLPPFPTVSILEEQSKSLWTFAHVSEDTIVSNFLSKLDKPVIKSHGSTDEVGFANSLKVCEKIIKGNLIDKIKKNII